MTAGEDPVLKRLVRWANGEPLVRALVLTSSRANPKAAVDAFSDYDVIIVAAVVDVLERDSSWLRAAYGEVMVGCPDHYECRGFNIPTRLTLYEDGTKVDYSLLSPEVFAAVARGPELPDILNVGYRVLVDKDRLATDLPPPTLIAHVPARPSESEFLTLVDDFWLDAAYVAKNLHRDELLPAKYILDAAIKFNTLRRMLEWRVETANDWSLSVGFMGRGLKRHVDSETWKELQATFAGAEKDENWNALFRTTALFRRTAREVAGWLGYAYPETLDGKMMDYLRAIRGIETEAGK